MSKTDRDIKRPCFSSENSPPTLSIPETVILKPGDTGIRVITAEASDPDGMTPTLEAAPGFNTSCLSISGFTISVPIIDLMKCDIA